MSPWRRVSSFFAGNIRALGHYNGGGNNNNIINQRVYLPENSNNVHALLACSGTFFPVYK